MSENELHLILQLWWSLGVEDPWLLSIFPTSGLPGASQSIWWGIHHQLYGSTFISIWGSGPHRSYLSSSPLCAPVGFFLDTPTGVSGPAVTDATQIWPCSPLTIEGIELLTQGTECHHYVIMLVQCLEDIIQGSFLVYAPDQVSQKPLQ